MYVLYLFTLKNFYFISVSIKNKTQHNVLGQVEHFLAVREVNFHTRKGI